MILGFDGLDPQTVDLLVSEGRLPHFARLRADGAHAPLRSQMPMLSPIVWTTIATGKGAADHGIGHFVALDSRGEAIPASSTLRRVEALWTMASRAGKTVAAVGWWATWPPEPVRGTMVSDHAAYHFLFDDGLADRSGDEIKTHPPEAMARLAPLLRRPGDLGAAALAPFVADPAPATPSAAVDFGDDLEHFRWALATALSYRDIGLTLWREDRPDLGLVYIEGTDSASHLFGHLFRAEGLGGELRAQQQRFGGTVEAMYGLADEIVGQYLEAMDARTTLVVLSDHGFELGRLHDDPTRSRDLRRVSAQFHRLDGVLYLYGRGVAPGTAIAQPTILDIAPTVLALLGMPAARDMPGRVLREAFDPARMPTLDLARVETYERPGGRLPSGPVTRDDEVRKAQLEHLRSLGYLGGGRGADDAIAADAAADRNLAAAHFEAGRYRDAAVLYRQLVDAAPDDPALRASLAGVLGALERYDLALVELGKAIELDPLNAEAYHNRAVIHERRGEVDAAVRDYREALRYRSGYQPSRQALARLGADGPAPAPRSEAEARAVEIAERAGLEARKANYHEASRLLDEAGRLAPDLAVVYHYRANVAFLTGDLAAAETALERALELEPDNALFRTNLERLRRKAPP